jgi:polyhydroxybutyrate depolymerase
MHSALDENVPVAGGPGTGPGLDSYPPLDATIDRWIDLDGCARSPEETRSGAVVHRVWKCANNAAVEVYLTDDGGHGWPGGLPGSIRGDEPSKSLDATTAMLEFFARVQLP